MMPDHKKIVDDDVFDAEKGADGPDRIGPVRASTLSTIEPLCAVVLAAVVLDETIAPVQLAGGALIVAAAILIARARRLGPDA